MKQLLLTFLLLPFYCHAQLEAGINGDVIPSHSKSITASERISSGGSMFGVSLSYKINGAKIGVGYDRATLTFKDGYIYNGISETVYYANPQNDLFCYVDREFKFDKLYTYFGLSLGWVFIQTSDYHGPVSDPDQSFDGFSCGGHVGIGYDVHKGFCINAQAGLTFMRLSPGTSNYSEGNVPTSFSTFPVSLGIHYKFHSRKKNERKQKNGLNINRFVK